MTDPSENVRPDVIEGDQGPGFQLAQPNLLRQGPAAAQYMPVLVRDWQRIKSQLERLNRSLGPWGPAGWTVIGAGAACVITGIGLLPLHPRPAGWIFAVFFLTGAALVALGVTAVRAGHRIAEAGGTRAADILEDMNAIEQDVPDLD